jgi:aerobic-type carbon monoxide dehydrogenase small subunit (CoxS/CutS family)
VSTNDLFLRLLPRLAGAEVRGRRGLSNGPKRVSELGGLDMAQTISFKLNGKPVSVTTDDRRPLLWVLRTDLGLTGTKFGCGRALCGACTVLVDNKAVRSCVYPVRNVSGKEVITIEGLAQNGDLHPLQKAFAQHDALQCGFCTPGMILGAYSFLYRNPQPTEAEIIQGMEGHLCRCGAHVRIIKAIQTAAAEMKGGSSR